MFAHLRQAQPVLQLAFRAQTGISAWDRAPLAALRCLAGSFLQCSTSVILAEAERLVREAAGVSANVDRRALCLGALLCALAFVGKERPDVLLSCRRSWRAEDLSSITLQLVNSRVIVADTGLNLITAQVKGSAVLLVYLKSAALESKEVSACRPAEQRQANTASHSHTTS